MSGFCDIHTHILPGIDDGARNWDMCLEMIDRAWEGGVRRMIATPHYLPWQKENTAASLIRRCWEAEFWVKKELGHDIRIYPGQEIFYHIDMIEKLNREEILTLAGSRYILVEFDVEVPYSTLLQAVNRTRAAGFYPIIAHVERYRCLRDEKHFESAADAGALYQVNFQSLQGGVFNKRASWCKKQLQEERIQFAASDMHNLSSRPPVSLKDLLWLKKKLSREYFEKLLYANAKEIVK